MTEHECSNIDYSAYPPGSVVTCPHGREVSIWSGGWVTYGKDPIITKGDPPHIFNASLGGWSSVERRIGAEALQDAAERALIDGGTIGETVHAWLDKQAEHLEKGKL